MHACWLDMHEYLGVVLGVAHNGIDDLNHWGDP